ncbi:alcohol dehydrogenase catalytic domain-containing protein [Sphingomonas sp. S1-29]|uniref:Alcohol dehydrogenase catalytic domain-containing protein n=1 Tax=Sphingomonas qomolangmaensis TaxID=2918765 RepID=A0ABY5LAP5_9SPHN|nr:MULTISPECIES: zinc-binding dehydrogenase [Sphingomonas]UUL83832.1 alcohol dehydrogenase catalytic domain-containing protein [Sphingomonas qomolangmaensis]UZK70278.1 alcohol dehydrogenase catalytic domain-containing protein [Sphingomonas sp. S1-29]
MRAALKTADGRFQVTEVERPIIPTGDFVLARVRVAGICGTDLRHWNKAEPELECHIVGHELAGEVVEVGADVTNLKPGDRVVIETVMGDGVCPYCRIQRYNICEHLYDVRTKYVSRAYGEFVCGPQSKFYPLPDHVSFEEAALIDTFSVCLHAHHRAGVGVNQKIAIIGAGPIGLGQLQLAKLSGADVLIVDRVASSLELATKLGADVVVDTSKGEDVLERVLAFAGERGADVCFECAGGESMAETLPLATKLARRGGKVVVVGGFDAGELSIPLEWQRIQMSEIEIVMSASFAFHDIYPEQGMVLQLLADGKLDAASLITHRFDLDHINDAFETADAKETTGAVFVAITIS